MNYPIIFKLLSAIAASIGAAFAVCLGVGFYYDAMQSGEEQAISGFAISLTLTLALASALYYLGREGEQKMFRKEALTVIGLGWILASLIGAIPYLLIQPGCTLADAIFESTSGLTTTGATVFSNLERMPRSLMFWRCLSQWMGGLGVVVFFVAILSFLGVGGKILFSREFSARSTDLDSARVQTGVLRILKLYLGLSVFFAVVYRFCGLEWYDAVCHMFTTLSTGGFSTYSNSIAGFQSARLEWVVVIFMAIGGTSFLLMLRLLRRDWSEVRHNTEVRGYYLTLALAISLIAGLLWVHSNPENLHELLRQSAFQVVSIMTTTGYTTADFDAWAPATHAILVVLMVIGGSSGSTSGGIKVVRLIVTLRICRLNIEKAFRTHVVRSVKINGVNLDQNSQEEVITYLALVGLVLAGSAVLVTIMEPTMSLAGGLSAMMASLFNIGPGFAEVGPTRSYAGFHDLTKYFLSLLMIMGRLELYAILVLFSPSLWRRFS